MTASIRRRSLLFAGLGLGLWGWTRVRPLVGAPLGLEVDVLPAPKGRRLRVVTWNLRNFPDHHNTDRLAEHLDRIEADLFVFQEVRDVRPLRSLLPNHACSPSPGGGRHGQHLAFAWDRRTIEASTVPHQDTRLALDGQVRPAWIGSFRGLAARQDFTVIGVHLKATSRGYPQRQIQWSALRAIVESIPAQADLLLVGDFNATGPGGHAQVESEALTAFFGETGLRRLPASQPCTAYWDGRVRDRWQVPSVLDMVWARGFSNAPRPWVVHPLSHCARLRCTPVQSTPAHPDPDLGQISDHCPIVVDLPSPLHRPTHPSPDDPRQR